MPTFSFVEFMREGGWGMYPVLILGLVGLASSVRYAARPERYCLRFIAVLWVTLVVAVTHATVTDVAAVFAYLEDPARAPDGQMARLLTLIPLLAAAGIYRESTTTRVVTASEA